MIFLGGQGDDSILYANFADGGQGNDTLFASNVGTYDYYTYKAYDNHQSEPWFPLPKGAQQRHHFGADGDDNLQGNIYNDSILIGGEGLDTITGGAGSDRNLG